MSAAAELDTVPAGPALVPAGVPVRSGRVHVGRLRAALPRSGPVRVLAGFRTVAWLGGPEDVPPGLGPMPYRGIAEVDGRGRVVLDRQARAWLAVATPGAFEAHRRALADTARDVGGVDMVVHNASTLGTTPLPPIATYDPATLHHVLDVNLVAPLALTGLLLPHLHPGARVVAITSDAAVEAYAGWGAYGASKAALDQAFAVLGVERPDLRVYRVDPGEMRTEMYMAAVPDDDPASLPPPEVSVPGLRALLLGDLPSGRYQARELVPVGDEEIVG